MKTFLTIFVLSTMFGCSSKDANHLNIVQLPIAAIGSVIENSSYNYKRSKVERYARAHYDTLKIEFRTGSGSHLEEIMRLAHIKTSKVNEVKRQLRRSHSMIFHNTLTVTERVMQSFSRLHIPRKKTKNMNDVSYLKASRLVTKYVNNHFDSLRRDIKNGGTTQLSAIASRLHINDADKRAQFVHSLDGQYYQMYVDKVVVFVMVYGR